MAIRSGMQTLVNELRALTQVTSSDFTLEGYGTVWIDDDLQDVLDQYVIPFKELMTGRAQYASGTATYYDFYWQRRPVEEIASGTGVFEVTTEAGSAFGTAAFSVNYKAGRVTFDDDQGTNYRYVSGRQYDIKGAAAELWRKRAGYLALTAMDISTDNHSVKRSQLMKHALDMAERFEAESITRYGGDMESGVGRVVRVDAW